MKRLEIRILDDIYDEIWIIHSETRKSLNQVINELVKKGLETTK